MKKVWGRRRAAWLVAAALRRATGLPFAWLTPPRTGHAVAGHTPRLRLQSGTHDGRRSRSGCPAGEASTPSRLSHRVLLTHAVGRDRRGARFPDCALRPGTLPAFPCSSGSEPSRNFPLHLRVFLLPRPGRRASGVLRLPLFYVTPTRDDAIGRTAAVGIQEKKLLEACRASRWPVFCLPSTTPARANSARCSLFVCTRRSERSVLHAPDWCARFGERQFDWEAA